jgi:hypothetical protein
VSYPDKYFLIKVDKGSDWTSEVFALPPNQEGTLTVTVNGNNYTLQDNRVVLSNITSD